MKIENIYFNNLSATYNYGTFFSIEKKETISYGPSVCEHCKLYYITSGSCIFNVKGEDLCGNAGDMFIIPAGVEHSFTTLLTDEPFCKYYIHCDIYPDVKMFESFGIPYKLSMDEKAPALRYFKKIVSCAKRGTLTDILTTKSLLINLISEFVKYSGIEKIDDELTHNNRLSYVVEYINGNLNKQLPLDELARMTYTNKNNFIKIFSENLGQTPAKYIRTKRYERAKEMISTTELSISDVAASVGVSDIAHFSKVFKSIYNMSPKEYKYYFKKHI